MLLDDVLSALDVHTAKWVVDKCFRGDLIKGRTLILVVRICAAVILNMLTSPSDTQRGSCQ